MNGDGANRAEVPGEPRARLPGGPPPRERAQGMYRALVLLELRSRGAITFEAG
jgi:hypothetical protein